MCYVSILQIYNFIKQFALTYLIKRHMMEASKVRNEATLKEELMLVYWNMIQVFGYSVQNHPENTKLFWNTETRRPPRQQVCFLFLNKSRIKIQINRILQMILMKTRRNFCGMEQFCELKIHSQEYNEKIQFNQSKTFLKVNRHEE